MREHYERVALLFPDAASHLEVVPLPYQFAHVWLWWMDLHSGRQIGMSMSGLSWEAIDAYNRLRQLHMMPSEVSALRAIELEYLRCHTASTSKS